MSKLILCEKCFSELTSTGGFCPYCGAPITFTNGFDIYNKGDKFYLRYRKGNLRAQTPLAPNYNNLSTDAKKSIYKNAKLTLNSKIAAKSLQTKTISKIETFGDLIDSYLHSVYTSKLCGTGKSKIKISTFDNGYVSMQSVLKRYPIYTLALKDMNYTTLKTYINDFIKDRMDGTTTGKPVLPSTISLNLSFIQRIITYACDEELLVIPYTKMRQLFQFIQEITPTEDDSKLTPRNRTALSAEQYNLFLKEFFRDEPTEPLAKIFEDVITPYTKNNIILHNLLLLCFKRFNAFNHSIEKILYHFRNDEMRILKGDYCNPKVINDHWRFHSFMKKTYKSQVPPEQWEMYFRETIDTVTTQALKLFPLCYAEFAKYVETTQFDKGYYPIIKLYYHDKQQVTSQQFDPTLPGSIVIYKQAQKKNIPNLNYTNSWVIPLLLLMSQTGLRFREAYSLRLSDLSTYTLSDGTIIKTINVQQQFVYAITLDSNGVPIRNNTGHIKRKVTKLSPKSRSSNRVLPLTPLAELAVSVALQARTTTDPNEPLFCPLKNSSDTYEPDKWMTIMLNNIRCYNLSGTHTLRRTVASQLAQHGYSELFIGQILGHTEKSITAHYVTIDLEHMYSALCTSLNPDWFNNNRP